MKRKKEIVLLALGILVAVAVTCGVSYALFTTVARGEKSNVMNAGTLRMTFNDTSSNNISLTSAVPMTDATGMKGTAYTFTIQNTGTLDARYNLKIEENQATYTAHKDTGKIFANGKLKLGITKAGNTTYQLYNRTAIDTGVLKSQESITYTIRIWIDYNAGNEVQGNHFHGKFIVEVVQDYGNYEANEPELVPGLIPVTYNGSDWVKANQKEKWYDYENQHWANAVTVKESNRTTYENAATGTVIPMSEINTMWVWIPRYEYKYTNLGTQYAGGTKDLPGEIEINFIPQNQTASSNTSTYKIHPAFTLGEKQLSGIWVGKFETGYLQNGEEASWTTVGAQIQTADFNKVIIKPNVYSWRRIIVSRLFEVAQSMTKEDNAYGLTQNTDTHPMKNEDWGAVAYLSQSKYGKYGNSIYEGEFKEVYKNDFNGHKTGCSAGMAKNASTGSSTCNPYNNLTDRGSGKGSIGGGASTTGNIYGVYDMNGGSWEYTMGNYNHYSGYSSKNYTIEEAAALGRTDGLAVGIWNSGYTGTCGFDNKTFNGLIFPDEKYYDLYTTTNINTACNGGICYGHALSETSRWYNDYAQVPQTDRPWSMRGGYYNSNSSDVGIFNVSTYYGNANNSHSFRIVLT